MQRHLRACFLFLAMVIPVVALATQPVDILYAGINDLRLHRCQTGASPAPILAIAAELEAAARRRAGGESLSSALATMESSFMIGQVLVVGGDPATALQRLAERHCDKLGDADFSHMGIVFQRDRWWIVLGGGSNSSGVSAASAETTTPEAMESAAIATLVPAMLKSVNAARSQSRSCGNTFFPAAPALTWNAQLAQAAANHAGDMTRRRYFSHDSPEGESSASRAETVGYHYQALGENIAAVPSLDMEVAMAGWLHSPGHCANIMSPDFTEMGAAVANAAGSHQGKWVQVFGRSL